MYAFDVQTYLGHRYSGYGVTLEVCRTRHEAELAYQTATQSSAPERFPFYRTSVLNDCHPAALAGGGYAWGVEADDAWGAVMPSRGLCDSMRATLVPRAPAGRLGPCRPVTLTPR